jgi:hypothetical protein
MNKMNSIKKSARVAGLLYLFLAITSIFGLMYVPSKIIVPQDTLSTVHNIMASPIMFRLGIISNLIYLVVFVFLVLAFYDLFKEVNKKLSILMVALVLVAIPVAFILELNQFAILLLIGGDGSLKAVETGQLYAIVQLFLNLYEYGGYMVMLFWGLWLFPLGLLAIKSKFIPPVLGYLLIIGCFGYLISSFTFLLSPHYGRIVFPIATIPSAVAEFSIILWLLIKGIKEQNPELPASLPIEKSL